MTTFFGIIFSCFFLIISPALSYVVFRENPVIYTNSEGIDLIDEYPITDKSSSIESHIQKIPKKDDKSIQIQPLTLSDLTSFLGLNENYFGSSKSLAKELQAILTEKNHNIGTVSSASSSSQSSSSTNTENKSGENELEDLSSNESTSIRSNTNQEPLNFGEVLTLLALWHLANMFNDYVLEEQKQAITTIAPKKSKVYNEQHTL